MGLISLPPPSAFGLDPEKFPSWRPNQEMAINRITDSQKRFVLQVHPTGAGKSCIYVTAGMLINGRTLFLTANKGLQDQLKGDFASKMVTIMGKSNYRCRLEPSGNLTCDNAPCRVGFNCEYRQRGCVYWDEVRRAAASRLVSTNYAYWIMNREHSGRECPIGKFDMIVCDEAHSSPDTILNALTKTIYLYETNPIPWPLADATYDDYMYWLGRLLGHCSDVIKELRGRHNSAAYKQLGKIIRLKNKVELLREYCTESNWVIDHSQNEITFTPIWPSWLSEPLLFRNTKKVFMTSATIRPKTMDILGLKPEDYDYEEYPNFFPIERRPIFIVPTTRVDVKTFQRDPNAWREWLTRIDQIIRTRLHRKGIVHTVSYERCEQLMRISEFRDYFLSHNRNNIRVVVKEFKAHKPPKVLVSPSVVTGYDFPYDECRWQIICKIPFPDQRSVVEQKRKEIDNDWGSYCAMQTIQQACGRGMRAAGDYCETFVIDDHAKWFFYKNPTRSFAAQWFLDALKNVPAIPELREIT